MGVGSAGASTRGSATARLRPRGAAALPPPPGIGARLKAEYVLAVLDEAAKDVNDRVRQQEDAARIYEQLVRGGHHMPHAVVAAVLGPAASLILERELHVRTDERGHPLGMGAHAAAAAVEGTRIDRLHSWTRKLSLVPSRKAPVHAKAGSRVAVLRSGGGSWCSAKLFLLRDRMLLARRPTSSGQPFQMLCCWPIDEIEVTLGPSGGGGSGGGSGGGVGGGGVGSDPAEASAAAQVSLVFVRAEERLECMCTADDADEVLQVVAPLQEELVALQRRLMRRSSVQARLREQAHSLPTSAQADGGGSTASSDRDDIRVAADL